MSSRNDLGAAFDGRVVWPQDDGFDAARRVWNAMADKRPAVIAECASVDDVRRAVAFARDRDLLIAIRGGGHSIAGFSTCDDGLLLDLGRMRSVSVDAGSRLARAEGGARWADLDRATATFDLATTGGVISTTGIAGLTLGGGIGYLMRAIGLACDRVVAFEMVTAEGDVIIVDEAQDAELYWGLRGGGGNFGIVTSFTYRLAPLPSTVLAGMLCYPIGAARDMLRFFRDFTKDVPDELTTYASLSPGALGGEPLAALLFCYAGEPSRGERVLAPARQLTAPVDDLVAAIPYVQLQSQFDETNPPGLRNYWKSHFFDDLSDEAIDLTVEHFMRKPAPDGDCPRGGVVFEHMGGAVSRVDDDATAVGNRGAQFSLELISIWRDAADTEAQVRWARDAWLALEPFATGGSYVNYLAETGPGAAATAFGPEKLRRLVALKDRYDPTNAFRFNHNIAPSGAGTTGDA